MPLAFPPLYVIIGAILPGSSPAALAERLVSAGVELIQYRDKQATSRTLYQTGLEILRCLEPHSARLIVNDRPDIAALVEAAGVHVGQDDLPVAAARAIVGPGRWVGVSTHTLEQVRQADATGADYLAFGPIFETSTKVPADPAVGIEGLRRARALTLKPLVAIGGITLDRAAELWRAGADSVAVARDVAQAADPAARARSYLLLAAEVFGERC
ncbi:MAG TPA: thiamine phosphate synthase [Candidatus Acidoferrales bacterium]|nr:thiamine phosphate synthase [Candidatus Acidoferrales bacterium]